VKRVMVRYTVKPERVAENVERGSVEFSSTYPGMYVPQPLALRQNNTQFDHAPITIRAARQVGNILK
jgi:hypothetical protein